MGNDLFNPKTIERLCDDVKLSSKQEHAAKEWLRLLDASELEDEQKNYLKFATIVLDRMLGYPITEIDFETDRVEFQFRDADGRNMLCFEAKGTSTKDLFAPQHRGNDHRSTVQQTWGYMGDINLEYGICTNYRYFVLFTKQNGTSKYHKFDFASIGREKEKIKEFVGIFSKKSIIDDRFVQKLEKESIVEERGFTKEFYKLFHETRLMMIKSFQKNNVARNDAIHYTQIYLNRLIFMFFAQSHGFIKNKLFTTRVTEVLNSTLISEHSKMVSDEILGLFQAMNAGSHRLDVFGFNGGLFKKTIQPTVFFTDLEEVSFFDDVRQNARLKIKPNKVTKIIINKYQNQLNPIIVNLLMMDSFNFTTEVNVNILGHVFEQSVSDLEELREEKTSKKKIEGIYYTPEYITDYICRNTIIPCLSKSGTNSAQDLIKEYENDLDELENRFKAIKILDPACGSGAFLVKAVDILLEIHKEIQIAKESKGEYSTEGQFQLTKWNEEAEARTFVKNNVCGVDVNSESVEITKLSLFLKIASKRQKLVDLSKNIKFGNSLIDDKDVDERYFDWAAEFSKIMKLGKFDVVIGNPPYGKYKTLNEKQKNFLKKNGRYGKTSDISEAFIRLVLDKLSKKHGFFGFIVPKGLSYVKSWGDMRKILLKYNIKKLIDASKAFDDVLYEQMIFILRNQEKDKTIETGTIRPDSIGTSTLPLSYFSDRVFPTGLDKQKLSILKKIQKNSKPVKELMDSWYGKGGLTPKINTQGKGVKLLTGKEIARYGENVGIEPWFLNQDLTGKDKRKTEKEKVVVQDIVAHITNPVPYIKLTASLDTQKRFCLNTVMCFAENQKGLKNKFLLALLNSKLTSFYFYFFVYNQAIRTMHFMPGYADYVPIPNNFQDFQEALTEKCTVMLDTTTQITTAKVDFFTIIKSNYGLKKISKKLFELQALDFKSFLVELKKGNPKARSLSTQDDLLKYFNRYKNHITELNTTLEQTNEEINNYVYKMYNLDDNEIKIIEDNVPL